MRVTYASSTLLAVLALGALGTATASCFTGSDTNAKPDSGNVTGDDDDKDAGEADTDDAGGGEDGGAIDAPVGPISFKDDLIPAFQQACGLASSCHLSTTSDERIAFGSKRSPLAADDVYAALMKKSKELPSMPYVTPSSPDKSYLLHKVEGTQGKLTCPANDLSKESDSKEPCGDPMPVGTESGRWDDSFSDTNATAVRAWIEQGAPNN